ncbi:hypothetical protein PV327_003002 [Microctonus hyperodae]|uniref:Uncharacterized protein n=1 Tax=Microctonus hyperodae TaxID=165561 RepID=A0AA39L0K2_MICHY|nr:hypothetical protein PV327_003002 [Microctonus hyperodae]
MMVMVLRYRGLVEAGSETELGADACSRVKVGPRTGLESGFHDGFGTGSFAGFLASVHGFQLASLRILKTPEFNDKVQIKILTDIKRRWKYLRKN